MMGRVAVDDIDAAVDQPSRKPDVLARLSVSPIAAPMNRGNCDVVPPLDLSDALLDGRGRFVRKIEQEVILYPVMSETSSNRWNLSVISDFSLSA
jgi:hypothetical protein